MDKPETEIERVSAALIAYQSALYGFLYVQLGDRQAANDVLQDTDLYIPRNASHLDSIDNFKPWARAMAAFQLKRHRLLRERESRRILFDSATADLLAETLAAPEARDDNAEIAIEALTACLSKLPEEKRRLIRRRYWNDESLESIAGDTSTPGAVAVTLHRIRRQLGDCVRDSLCRLPPGTPALPASREETEHALLLEAAYDGSPAALDALLARDPSARADWMRDGLLQAALVFNAPRLKIDRALAPRPEKPRASNRWLKAAALLLLLTGTAFALIYRTEQKPVPAATFTNQTGETSTMKTNTTALAAVAAASLSLVPAAGVHADSAAQTLWTIPSSSAGTYRDTATQLLETRDGDVFDSYEGKIDTVTPPGTVYRFI